MRWRHVYHQRQQCGHREHQRVDRQHGQYRNKRERHQLLGDSGRDQRPYPGDGTNSNGSGIANALTLAGIVRSDIRSSASPGGATASGIKITLELTIVNVGSSCASAAGAAVYVWHCDENGNHSTYPSGLTNENYLHGVQQTDSNGVATFTSIFPGCYAGRMPHIHFEIYPSLAKATSAGNRLKTSQLGFPIATCNEVYDTSGYALRMATVTGDPVNSYTVSLTVGVSL